MANTTTLIKNVKNTVTSTKEHLGFCVTIKEKGQPNRDYFFENRSEAKDFIRGLQYQNPVFLIGITAEIPSDSDSYSSFCVDWYFSSIDYSLQTTLILCYPITFEEEGEDIEEEETKEHHVYSRLFVDKAIARSYHQIPKSYLQPWILDAEACWIRDALSSQKPRFGSRLRINDQNLAFVFKNVIHAFSEII